MVNRRYMVGYNGDDGFVTLYETDNLRVAMAVMKRLAKTRNEAMHVKKRVDKKRGDSRA